MSEDNETLKEILNKMPEENTALSIAKKMSENNLTTLVVENKKSFTPFIELNRAHHFKNLNTFMKYIDRYKTPDSCLYYDDSNSLVHCVLNESKITGYPEQIDCAIDNKSLFCEIAKIEAIRGGVGFLDYIKANKKNIDNFIDLFYLFSAIKVSTSIEKLDVQGKNSEYNFIVKSEVKGQVSGVPKELPDKLVVGFTDYSMDFNTPTLYFITADIYYTVSKEGVLSIEIKVNNKEELKNILNKTFYGFINDNAPKGVLVTIGAPNYEQLTRE